MKTQLLYVLVSTPEDLYLEQALISIASARLRNPDARIILLTDREMPQLSACVDQTVTVNLDPALPAMKRSRLLKTGMRRYVKGDFLYIDADTLVTASLEAIDQVEAPLAACLDLHMPLKDHSHRAAIINTCKKLGYDVSAAPLYFNGGVMLARDTPQVHEFFECWTRNYEAGYARGVRSDQPSLAQTIAQTGLVPLRLEDSWNCQALHGVRYLREARIFHYLCTNASSRENGYAYSLHNPEVLLDVRKNGVQAVQDIIQDPFRGFPPYTQVFSGQDLYFFRTRRYRWLRKGYRPGKCSLLEFVLKVWDHLTGRV